MTAVIFCQFHRAGVSKDVMKVLSSFYILGCIIKCYWHPLIVLVELLPVEIKYGKLKTNSNLAFTLTINGLQMWLAKNILSHIGMGQAMHEPLHGR